MTLTVAAGWLANAKHWNQQILRKKRDKYLKKYWPGWLANAKQWNQQILHNKKRQILAEIMAQPNYEIGGALQTAAASQPLQV